MLGFGGNATSGRGHIGHISCLSPKYTRSAGARGPPTRPGSDSSSPHSPETEVFSRSFPGRDPKFHTERCRPLEQGDFGSPESRPSLPGSMSPDPRTDSSLTMAAACRPPVEEKAEVT